MQPVTYLGVMMLVCIYATLAYLIVEDRRTAEVAAIAQSKNLATLFEQLIFRSFKGVDNNIKLVRQFYLLNRSNIYLAALLRDSDNQNDLTFQYTIVGRRDLSKRRLLAAQISASTLGIGGLSLLTPIPKMINCISVSRSFSMHRDEGGSC